MSFSLSTHQEPCRLLHLNSQAHQHETNCSDITAPTSSFQPGRRFPPSEWRPASFFEWSPSRRCPLCFHNGLKSGIFAARHANLSQLKLRTLVSKNKGLLVIFDMHSRKTFYQIIFTLITRPELPRLDTPIHHNARCNHLRSTEPLYAKPRGQQILQYA